MEQNSGYTEDDIDKAKAASVIPAAGSEADSVK
jgi:hypothetical protein